MKAISYMVSDKKFFHVFPYIGLCKARDSGASHVWPRDIISTNVVGVYSVMLHTKYQSSRPYGR